jgi:hypothetical protein
VKWIINTIATDVIQLGAHILNDHEPTHLFSDSTHTNGKTIENKVIGGGPVTVGSNNKLKCVVCK